MHASECYSRERGWGGHAFLLLVLWVNHESLCWVNHCALDAVRTELCPTKREGEGMHSCFLCSGCCGELRPTKSSQAQNTRPDS